MARPRTPTALLETRGSFRRHPDRLRKREGEPKPSMLPLGDPPESFDEAHLTAWKDIVRCAPTGVLTQYDELIVELGARLLVKVRSAGCGAAVLGQYRGLLASLGLTPADRSRVKVARPLGNSKNPFEF
jgi:hypothetical protein